MAKRQRISGVDPDTGEQARGPVAPHPGTEPKQQATVEPAKAEAKAPRKKS